MDERRAETVWSPARANTRDFCLSFAGLCVQTLLYVAAAAIGAWAVASSETAASTKVVVAGLSILVAFIVFVVASFSVCAVLTLRRQRDDARLQVSMHEHERTMRTQVRTICHTWCDEVRTLLDAQEAKKPKPPKAGRGGSLSLFLKQRRHEALSESEKIALAESSRRSEEREQIDAETVSEYIRDYRAHGTELCDALIPFGVMHPEARTRIHSPESVGSISIGLSELRDGANQLCN